MPDTIKPLFSWRGALLDSNLAPTARLVALALATYMSDRGDSAWPGAQRLAHDTGLSERAVRLHLGVLVQTGWLELVRRGGVIRGKHLGNEYRASIPPAMLPLHDVHPAPAAPMQEMHPTPAPDDHDPCTTFTPIHQDLTTTSPKTVRTTIAEDFEAWWSGWPRKVEKARARGEYAARRRQGVPAADLTAARDHYAASVADSEPRFVKHASSFLHGKDGPWSEYVTSAPAGASRRSDPLAATRTVLQRQGVIP